MDYFIQRFHHHLQERSINDAIELVSQEAEEAKLPEEQITWLANELVCENVEMFLTHYFGVSETV